MSELRNIRDDFSRRALYDIAKWGLIVIAGLAWTPSGLSVVIQKLALPTSIKWPAVVTIATLAIYGTMLLYARYGRFRPRYGRLVFDWEILRKDITYTRTDDGRVLYVKRNHLRALRDGLDVYRDKYHWTGNAGSAPRALVHGHEVRHTIRKNIWQVYEVVLGQTLKRGDEITVEVGWDLNDKDRRSQPFFSNTVEEPTSRVVLKLCLPESLGIRKAVYEVSSSIGSNKPFESRAVELTAQGEFTAEIDNPSLFHHYEVRWAYHGTQS